MKKLFQKTPVGLPKPPSHKEKHQLLLHAIGGGWYMKKISEKLPTLKKRKLSKKSQEKEDEIKINMPTANQNWNEWNKIEWVNPRKCDEQKNLFCVSSIKKKIIINCTLGWPIKLKPLDTDGF